MKQWILAFLLGLTCLGAQAQQAALENSPGYVDFGALDAVYGEPRVMINIGGILLKLMAAASHEDPETAQLMSSLEGVRVNVYDTGGESAAALEQMHRVKGLLQEQAWQPVVQVREEGEQVQIFMKGDEQGMQGLAVMTVNEEEAVFINILGAIDPSQLDKVMHQLNVDIDSEGE